MEQKKQRRVIALICNMDPGFLPLVAIKSLLEGVIPYLSILLPSLVVNLLYEKAEAARIFSFLAIFFLVFLMVRLVFQILKKQLENKKNHMLHIYAVNKAKKVFYAAFERLESSEFEKIMQNIQYNDENFGAFRNYMEELEKIWKGVFQIGGAVFIFVWMNAGVAETAVARQLGVTIFCLLLGTLFSAIWMILIQKKVNGKMPAFMDKIVDINTIFFVLYEDVVQNYRKGKDVRLFGMDQLIVKEGENMVRGFAPYAKKQIWLSQAAGMAGSIFSLLMGGISFAVMGSYALNGFLAPGTVISFAGSIQQLSSAVIGIAFALGSLNLWNVRMDGVFELFELEEEGEEADKGKMDFTECHKKGLWGQDVLELESIEFQDVSFRYPKGQEDILKHISLTMKKGEKMAVVGPNGSGKSTFIKLLCGLYEPTGGRILVNGQDRAEMDINHRRAYFAAVYQDFTLFSFTLGENIALGKRENMARLSDVLGRLKLTEKVSGMRDGLDTYLYQDYGENGREVSGGEAQKLAICRALYQDAPFVVLDEPTAALDPVSEYEVYKDFQTLVKEKTAVFVSHRLSSCRFCENIFVFEHGNLVQQGSHEELLEEKRGLYRKLWDVQAQYYVTK